MTIRSEGMEAVRNLLHVSIEASKDLRPALEPSVEEWRKTTQASFRGKTGPDGKRWEPSKGPNPTGQRTGAMMSGETARALPTGVQGLSSVYYSQIFKGGAKLGNRAAGARKKKGVKTRRRRGTSRRGTGPEVQPARHVAPVEKIRGVASVLDEEWMERTLERVAKHLAAEEQ